MHGERVTAEYINKQKLPRRFQEKGKARAQVTPETRVSDWSPSNADLRSYQLLDSIGHRGRTPGGMKRHTSSAHVPSGWNNSAPAGRHTNR